MSKLELVKAEHFGEIEADIYSNGNEIFMTINQLADCLEYSSRKGVEMLIDRNEYLKNSEFSGTHKLLATDEKQYNTRIFTEDGIYEVTMLSSQPKAQEFRAWIRQVLKALRRNEPVSNAKLTIQQQRAEAMLLNAKSRAYKTIMDGIKNQGLSPVAVEIFGITALEQFTGRAIPYRPEVAQTYSASEIAKEFGVTANRIGRIATANGLKTSEFGITVMDKSKYSAKEVPAFRYNQIGKNRIEDILNQHFHNKS